MENVNYFKIVIQVTETLKETVNVRSAGGCFKTMSVVELVGGQIGWEK